ncbi:MarR family transcriptional regulator [uncultured Winogradskyella sp.]|uniref:MarR family winged helix-turn-helix transcriptional regulator n=1 Tax=uncultured Winogradskyella sp. TaxID=395353 RepID=UPI00260376B4|nr:MarR family transcriptional regulator [uncultured Winogradskyella sp.]
MSDFNPKYQINNLSSKIVAGLERISEAYKVLLWEKAKLLGLSPIQIQILIFTSYHDITLCNVSHLAKEFNITKPTVSDAVRVLLKKELVAKVFPSNDSRSYAIQLTKSGQDIVKNTEHFAQPIKQQVDILDASQKEDLFKSITQLIYKLNQVDVLSVQRTCLNCRFYEKDGKDSFCNLLETKLKTSDIRIDCEEFQLKNT